MRYECKVIVRGIWMISSDFELIEYLDEFVRLWYFDDLVREMYRIL